MFVFIKKIRSQFGKKAAAVLIFVTLILFALNPEIISFIFVVDAIGIDIFILLLTLQLKDQLLFVYRSILYPVISFFRRHR